MLKKEHPSPLILESEILSKNYERSLRNELTIEIGQHLIDDIFGHLYNGIYFQGLILFKARHCEKRTIVKREISSNRKAYFSDLSRLMISLINLISISSDIKERKVLLQELLSTEEAQYQQDSNSYDDLNSLRRFKKAKSKIIRA